MKLRSLKVNCQKFIDTHIWNEIDQLYQEELNLYQEDLYCPNYKCDVCGMIAISYYQGKQFEIVPKTCNEYIIENILK